MSEQEINEIIAQNLTKFLNRSGKTQIDLADYMEVSQATVSNWCKGLKLPRMDKIDKICSFFNISRSDLMNDEEDSPQYYLNEETAEVAQEIFDNKELRALFDVQKDMPPEDLRALHSMALALKRKERGVIDDTGC